MSTDPDIPHTSAAGLMEHVAAPIDADAAAQALKHGARGAFVVAGIATGLLFIGWLAFYFRQFPAPEEPCLTAGVSFLGGGGAARQNGQGDTVRCPVIIRRIESFGRPVRWCCCGSRRMWG